MALAPAKKAHIFVRVDRGSATPFDSTTREPLAIFDDNLVACSWKLEPASGGMISADIAVRATRGSALREDLEAGNYGYVTIYRGNSKATKPSSGWVLFENDLDINADKYILFAGMAEAAEFDKHSDIVRFEVRGLGRWLKDIEYSGTFLNATIGEVFAAVTADVIGRENIPLVASVGDDMTLDAGRPADFNVQHRVLAGVLDYENESVESILSDLQDRAGGATTLAYGVRPRTGYGDDGYGEVYLLEWRESSWSSKYSHDDAALPQSYCIPNSWLVGRTVRRANDELRNSVTVYGGERSSGGNYSGKAEVSMSVRKAGRRHQSIVERDLMSDSACAEYAARWLEEHAASKVAIEVEYLDPMHMTNTAGHSNNNYDSDDLMYGLTTCSNMVRIREGQGDIAMTAGEDSRWSGWDTDIMAVKLTKGSGSSYPHIAIDTSVAPSYNATWSSSSECGHPNKKLEYGLSGSQFGSDRGLLYHFGYAIPDGATASLDGRVLFELQEKLRLRITQPSGAGSYYGIDIERYTGSAWINEIAGSLEVIPNDDNLQRVSFRVGGNTSTITRVGLWHHSYFPWRTLLDATLPPLRGVNWTGLDYASVSAGQEDTIWVCAGTASDGSTLDGSCSGNWEVYSFRVDEGRWQTSPAPAAFYYMSGMNEEGDTGSATVAAESHMREIMYPLDLQDRGVASKLLWLDLTDEDTTSGVKYWVSWTVDPVFHDGSKHGYHASLVAPASGDGRAIGADNLSGIDDASAYGIHTSSRAWRLGATGPMRRKLGYEPEVVPRVVDCEYSGSWSPLRVKISGGAVNTTVVGATDTMMARLDELERDTAEELA
jgi:hypothetical protein